MQENYLNPIYRHYNILDSIGLHLLEEGETGENDLEGCVTLYLKMFEFLFRLPLHPYGQRVP